MNYYNRPSFKRRKYYVYILANGVNGTLYVGVTGDLFSRVFQHKITKDPTSFTAKYGVNKLVYYEKHQYVNNALKREKQIKKWKRLWKIRLIKEINPDWKDLFKYFE